MSKPNRAQDTHKTVFGTRPLGEGFRRPDGVVVKVPMLDRNDPGFDSSWQDGVIADQAKNGSAALLAAMQRLQVA
ncbi:hypothetical protein [Sphingobium yanoikuyae]|uniref:hypothetical protein n=1 Tax=Sphingobium yanoikuyae TaxID=13690 RepID=UPI0035C73ABB